MAKRLARTISKVIKCHDNGDEPCSVKVTVRNYEISVRVDGGDEWAHMTIKQAWRLAEHLVVAAAEVDARQTTRIEEIFA